MNQVAEPVNVDYRQLRQLLKAAKSKGDSQLFQAVVDTPFKQKAEAAFLFLGFISFFLAKPDREVRLAAVSDTEQYHLSVNGYDFKAEDFRLSLDDDAQNDIVLAINTGQPQTTTDWQSVSRQVADKEQVSLNQASGGIAFSATYPLSNPSGGALMYSFFQYEENIGPPQTGFMEKYSRLVSQFITS